jgi:hypothetical protein
MRTKVKNQGPRKAASPSTEPNFYAMKSLPTGENITPDKSLNTEETKMALEVVITAQTKFHVTPTIKPKVVSPDSFLTRIGFRGQHAALASIASKAAAPPLAASAALPFMTPTTSRLMGDVSKVSNYSASLLHPRRAS